MSSVGIKRDLLKEIMFFANKLVTIVTVSGRTYTGILAGFHPDTQAAVLTEAKRIDTQEENKIYPKIFIGGTQVAEVYLIEKPFDLMALATELERVFRRPGDVKAYPEAGLLVVLERVRVTEKGVEGSGPVADRVRTIFDRFVREQKESEEE